MVIVTQTVEFAPIHIETQFTAAGAENAETARRLREEGELGLNMDRRKFDGLRYNDRYARSPRRIDRVNYIKYIEQEK